MHSYNDFVHGFANTQHDDIAIQDITQLPDGTTRAGVTLYATETGPSGTQIKTFQGWYILGQEDGTLKLLKAYYPIG